MATLLATMLTTGLTMRLAPTKQTSSELPNKAACTPTTTSTMSWLFSTAEELRSKTSYQSTLSTSSMASTLFAAEHVHGHAPKPSTPFACLSINPSCAFTTWPLLWRIVRVRALCRRTGWRSSYRGRGSRGRHVPLRDARGNLDIVVFARRVIPLRYPARRHIG